MPSAKDIKAKNERFAQRARDAAGRPRVRSADLVERDDEGQPIKRTGLTKGRGIVNPPKTASKRPQVSTVTLGLICFVVIGGVFFELARLFF